MSLKSARNTLWTSKTHFNLHRLMMMLDREKLEALEEEFQLHPEGIKMGNFVWLMKAAISHDENLKYDLVYGL